MIDPTAGQLWLSHWRKCEYSDEADMTYCDHPEMPACPLSPRDAIHCPTADAQLLRLIEKSLTAERERKA